MSFHLEAVEVRRPMFRLGPIDLDVPTGSWISVVGESGSGKSTLLGAISGLVPIDRGRIVIDGEEITTLKINERPCTSCQQDPLLFPVYTVAENLAFPLRVRGMSWKEAVQIAVASAADFRIPERILGSKGNRVSGGEARRIALARAFLRPFRVALLDEVTNGLDEATEQFIISMLSKVFHDSGGTFLFVSHDPDLALSMSSQARVIGRLGLVAVMRAGRLVQVGTPEEIYERPRNMYVAQLFGHVSSISNHTLALSGHAAVRAEDVTFSESLPQGPEPSWKAIVESAAYVGAQLRLEVTTPLGVVTAFSQDRQILPGAGGFVSFRRVLELENDDRA